MVCYLIHCVVENRCCKCKIAQSSSTSKLKHFEVFHKRVRSKQFLGWENELYTEYIFYLQCLFIYLTFQKCLNTELVFWVNLGFEVHDLWGSKLNNNQMSYHISEWLLTVVYWYVQQLISECMEENVSSDVNGIFNKTWYISHMLSVSNIVSKTQKCL